MSRRKLFCNLLAGFLRQIAFCQSDYTAAIATSREATAVNAVDITHKFMKLNQDLTTNFVVVDGRGTGLIHQLPEPFEIVFAPGLGTVSDALDFREKMFGALAQILWQKCLF